MKKGDIVKFKQVVDPGDSDLRMIVLDNPDKGRVMVQTIIDMPYQPINVYLINDLELIK